MNVVALPVAGTHQETCFYFSHIISYLFLGLWNFVDAFDFSVGWGNSCWSQPFGFSWTFWTECLLYSGKQWGGLLINFRSACQCKHWPCPRFWLPECIHVCLSVVAGGSASVNSVAQDLGWPLLKLIPPLLHPRDPLLGWNLCFTGEMHCWLGLEVRDVRGGLWAL
jgi:hypothetical protein